MVTAASDLPEFLWTGLVDLIQMMTLFENSASLEGNTSPTVLDFGCGCGRMTRFLNDYPQFWTAHGCEVNPQHVRWCQDNLKGVKSTQCGPKPPLQYDNQTFNLVYALSVFTHPPCKMLPLGSKNFVAF